MEKKKSDKAKTPFVGEFDEKRIAAAVSEILLAIGEDPKREGLIDTPKRAANSWRFLTKGYTDNIDDIINDALFDYQRSPNFKRDYDMYLRRF